MSFFRRLRGLEPLTDAEQATQDTFRREERAASWWEDNHNREGVSGDNVKHVGNHELWLQAMTKYNVTRQGMLNGYVRAYGRIPYWVTSDDYIGEE